MLDKIYVVTDLGPGDGGKGGIVHALAKKEHASVIIKRGGAQGSHGVKTSDGKSFNFSQWGCGTFEGIPTHCSPQMVISPVGLENEAEALSSVGVSDPYSLLSVDPHCICATPYHMIGSQLAELRLGDHPRGTIGSGVGQAYRMYKELGDVVTIRASQLSDRGLIYHMLHQQAIHYRELSMKIHLSDILPDDVDIYRENMELLFDPNYFNFILDLFSDVGTKIRLLELGEVIHRESGTAIVECSHGVLTDAETGFKPHVSAIRTLPCFTTQMLLDAGYNNEVIHLGVHRAYEIRHGAGPMPTYSEEFTKMLLPGSNKEENRWQGKVRTGPLDMVLLKRAIDVCKETGTVFDGICLTWFDQILKNNRKWVTCMEYQQTPAKGESYTDYLKHAEPSRAAVHFINSISTKDLFQFAGQVLRNNGINPPLSILSVGPTEVDKIYSKNI